MTTAREQAKEAALRVMWAGNAQQQATAANAASNVWEPIALDLFKMVGNPLDWKSEGFGYSTPTMTCRFCKVVHTHDTIGTPNEKRHGLLDLHPDEVLHKSDCRWLLAKIALGVK